MTIFVDHKKSQSRNVTFETELWDEMHRQEAKSLV